MAGLVQVSAVTVPDFGSTPMNAQERFLSRFEPDGHGFVYRASPGAPGVSVTPEERAEMVALDDDRGGIATILYVLTLPLAAAAGAGLSASPVTSPWAQAVAFLVFFGLPLSAGLWVYNGPNRIVRGRHHVDKGLSKAEAERRSIRDRSWPVLIVLAAGGVAGGLDLLRSTDHHVVVRLLGSVLVLISITTFFREAKIKFRMSAQDRRERAGKP